MSLIACISVCNSSLKVSNPRRICYKEVFGGNSEIVFLFFHKNVCCGYSLEVPTTYVFMEN